MKNPFESFLRAKKPNLDMYAFRKEITVLKNEKTHADGSGMIELDGVDPEHLEEIDAIMWSKIKSQDKSLTLEEFKKYQKELEDLMLQAQEDGDPEIRGRVSSRIEFMKVMANKAIAVFY